MEIKYKLNLYILAQGADAGPPLGTILGNMGVNSTNFCKEFNTLTSDLPNYLTVSSTIYVYTNRTYKLEFSPLPLGKIISLLKVDRIIRISGKEEVMQCMRLRDVIQLAKYKFPKLKLQQSLPIVLGNIKSHNVIIYG